MRDHDWYFLHDKTTNSGKALFWCLRCRLIRPTPDDTECGKCEACGFGLDTIGHAARCKPDELDRRLEEIPAEHAVAVDMAERL